MCPGKRSFWTSLAVSPFQGQSRGPRWLSLFDFGKTSSPLLGNFTDSPVQTVLDELNVGAKGGNRLEKCGSRRHQTRPHRGGGGGGNSQESSVKPRIQTLSFLLVWGAESEVHRQAKKRTLTESSFWADFSTFPNTTPRASNSDTMTPHVVQLGPT